MYTSAIYVSYIYGSNFPSPFPCLPARSKFEISARDFCTRVRSRVPVCVRGYRRRFFNAWAGVTELYSSKEMNTLKYIFLFEIVKFKAKETTGDKSASAQ